MYYNILLSQYTNLQRNSKYFEHNNAMGSEEFYHTLVTEHQV